MKKCSGFLMLLVVFLLASMPVAADVYEAPNSLIAMAESETKIVMEEEVTGISGETMAAFAVAPCIPLVATENMVTTDGVYRRSNYCSIADVLLGGGRARPGYT